MTEIQTGSHMLKENGLMHWQQTGQGTLLDGCSEGEILGSIPEHQLEKLGNGLSLSQQPDKSKLRVCWKCL